LIFINSSIELNGRVIFSLYSLFILYLFFSHVFIIVFIDEKIIFNSNFSFLSLSYFINISSISLQLIIFSFNEIYSLYILIIFLYQLNPSLIFSKNSMFDSIKHLYLFFIIFKLSDSVVKVSIIFEYSFLYLSIDSSFFNITF